MIIEKRIPSLDEAKKHIDSIDFSKIINKMMKKDRWKKSDAESICKYYRNFLYLTKKYNQEYGQLPPSEEVDEFWHNHILDTEQYIKDSDAIFGKYLHHYPYFGMDEKSNEKDLQNAFDRMQNLYEKEFGERIYRVRSLRLTEIIRITMQIISEFFSRKKS